MEINPKMVKWDEASPVDSKMVKWDESPDKSVVEQVVQRAGRVAGLGARAVATGVAELPLAVGEAVNQGYNLATGSNRPSVFQGWHTFLTNAGLPEPANRTERISTNVTSGMVGMGSQLAALRQATTIPGTTSEFVRELATQQPARQIVAGGTGAAGATAAAERGVGPYGQAAAGMVGGTLPFAGQIIKGQQSPETQRVNQVAREARDVGYRLPPSRVDPGVVNSVLEGGIAGKAFTDRTSSLKNQSITQKLIKEQLGIPENQPLSQAALNDIRQVAGKAYRDVAQLGGNAPQLVEGLKEARFQSSANWKHYGRSADPSSLNAARGFDNTVQQIESQLETLARNSLKPGLVDELRKARQKIAQTYSVEKALDDVTGTVDARVLARQLDAGTPLTGNLKTVARTADAFGEVMRPPEVVGSNPQFSMYDLLIAAGLSSGGYGMSGSPYGAIAGALPVARPMVRSLITSPLYQSAMVNPAPGNLTRPESLSLGMLPLPYSETR